MVKTDNEVEPQEVLVRNLGEKGSELAVFEFQGELRDLMISSMHEAYLTTGIYAPGARAVAPQGVMSAAFAARLSQQQACLQAFRRRCSWPLRTLPP